MKTVNPALLLLVLIFAGCAPGPTTITGSVGFLNAAANARTFPPALGWVFFDDVCYVRLIDDNGSGTVIWESPAYPASDLDQFIYNNDDYPGIRNPTPDSGYYIESFVITLTDTQLSTIVMPLRLEAFLFESPIVSPLNPVDPLRYSYYIPPPGDAGDIWWRAPFSIASGEVKNFNLFVQVPITP